MKKRMNRHRKQLGFTIVELLIVIVVIGILAAITVVAYNGIQDRAQRAKITSDLRNIENAINMARADRATVLGIITGNFGTAGACVSKPSGTDFAALARTDACWTQYLTTLDRISTAGGQNVRNLVDPWGRPYFIDENENEGGTTNCTKDSIGAYKNPNVSTDWTPMTGTRILVANSAPTC
jgi:prepilin-type N-terminal cleavage/methylation domain-containing protein